MDDAWRSKLTPEQCRVLREHGTERPGSSPLNVERRVGSVLCAACQQKLFDSGAKYESGAGWPSFSAPTSEGAINIVDDSSLGMRRTGVLCSRCGGHLAMCFRMGQRQPACATA